jgi:23S rRNA pseudouridine2605 synthase
MNNKKKGSSKTSGNSSRGKAGAGKSKPAFAFDKSSKGKRGAVRTAKNDDREEARGPRKPTLRRPASSKSASASKESERAERKSAPRGAASAKGAAGAKGATGKKSSRPASAIRTKSDENFAKRSGIPYKSDFNRAPKSFSKGPREGFEKKEESRFNEDEFFGRTEESSYKGKSSSTGKPKTGKASDKKGPVKKEGMSKRAEKALVRRKVDKDFIDIKFSKEKEATDSLHRELNVKKARSKDEPKDEEGIRLNRYLSNAGIASRREADQFIQEGLVRINGVVVTELGVKVMPGDSVKFRSKVIMPEKNVYVLLNKPKDFITTTDDPQDRRTVMSLVANACKERIVPVGRLDRNTTGLLLFTNDGDLAQKLTHPSSNVKKIYLVELDKAIAEKDFETIKTGKLRLFDGPVRVDDLAVTDHTRKVLGIEIHEGRNRIVRRIFEELGYTVMKLDRVAYAGLTKKDLSRGKWRFLTAQEISRLKYLG